MFLSAHSHSIWINKKYYILLYFILCSNFRGTQKHTHILIKNSKIFTTGSTAQAYSSHRTMPQKSQGFCVQGKSTQRALSIRSCHGVQNLFLGVRGCNKIGLIGFTGGMHIKTACCIFARWQHKRQIVLPTEICLRGDVASGRTIMARKRRPECKQRGIMTFTHHSPSFGPLQWVLKSFHVQDISHWRPRSNI